jgi:N-acetylmuramoyl-L-alanine amidase
MEALRRRWELLMLAWPLLATARQGDVAVGRVDLQAQPEGTRVIIELDRPARYRLFSLAAPDRVVIDILDGYLRPNALPLPAGAGFVRQLRAGARADGAVRLVLDVNTAVEPRGTMQGADAGTRLTIDLQSRHFNAGAGDHPADDTAGAKAAAPPAPPAPRELVIAVDAGHGGKDPGAHGPNGVLEKDVTLEIAKRLAEIINLQAGMRAVLTRDHDEYIPLPLRREKARAVNADLFISIHADAVRNPAVRGASVYVLNGKGATDEAARRLAARENAADLIGGVSLGDRDPMIASVLMDVAQNASLNSSIDVGNRILRGISQLGLLRKPRVLQAPFMVLKSPDVPSVLVETAYISNPAEERKLHDDRYRGRLARAIFSGVQSFFREKPPALVAAAAIAPKADGLRHVIRRGETLSDLAGRYRVSLTDLRQVNRLRSNRLEVGQVLTIPAATRT